MVLDKKTITQFRDMCTDVLQVTKTREIVICVNVTKNPLQVKPSCFNGNMTEGNQSTLLVLLVTSLSLVPKTLSHILAFLAVIV